MRILASVMLAAACTASETENHGLRVLPTPGPVVIDGQAAEWDLSGGIFACGEVEHLRDRCAVWLHAMYDADKLYVLARWKDPTPLNNPERFGGHGFNGDCLQLRFVVEPGTAQQTATWWTAWRDVSGRSVIDRSSPGAGNGFADNPLPNLTDAGSVGAQQSFTVDSDGAGYVQELAIPWKLLSAAGGKPAGRLRMTIEPNFTAGEYGRITIKDLFDAQITAPDRVFTFRAFKHWGWATLEPTGKVTPQAVRLADARTFPVSQHEGRLVIDWEGLQRHFAWPGFKPLTFTLPADGYVSLNILDSSGMVVRHLLNWEQRSAGPHTVQWDGLSDAVYRTPGRPLPAGTYSWQAITHPGAKLTLRGWASCTARAPWVSSPLDYWLGDHGVPTAVATDGRRMYIACNGAEGGRHLVATDLTGKVVWGLQNTTGAADPEAIAVADGAVYVLHPRGDWSVKDETLISRADTQSGAYASWPKGTSHMVAGKDIWGSAGGPSALRAIDARDGNLYVTASETRVFAMEVRDWNTLLTRIAADPALTAAVLQPLSKRKRQDLDRFIAGELPRDKALGRDGIALTVLAALNRVISGTAGSVHGSDSADPTTSLATRRDLERRLGDALVPTQHGLAVLDPANAAVRTFIPVPLAGAVRAIDAKTVLVACVDRLVAVDLESRAVRLVAEGHGRINGITIDGSGTIHLSLGAPHMQVVAVQADGRVVRRIGRDGGRPALGRFLPDGMHQPAGIAIDPEGNLWVAERDAHPKRVSVWSAGAGALSREFFGPTHYGAGGGAIDPRDPDLMVGAACEWRIDPLTGRDQCLATFDRDYHAFATFREAHGRQYLYTYRGQYSTGQIMIFERVGMDKGKHGSFALRAVYRAVPSADGKSLASEMWTDANGDEVEQAGEITRRASYLSCTGSNGWSLNLGPDLALYGIDQADKQLKRLSTTGFTACGAPIYDIAKPGALPAAFSDGYLENYGCALPSADNSRILINLRVKNQACDYMWNCFDLATGKLTWTYPNAFFQVHGSHSAPAPDPGLFRGAYGPVGTAELPGVGGFWAINGNLGEWAVLSSDGYYVTRLFNGNVFEWQWPKPVVGADMTNLPPGSGGEDFGGSMTQAADGKVYIQSGKMALWNIALSGLEKTSVIRGNAIELTADDTRRALALREEALQKANASANVTVKRTSVTFTGSLSRDFATATRLSYQKSAEAAVHSALAYDASKLYIGWEVADPTPWSNGATDMAQMYACGDTVDLQLSADPKADGKRQQAAPGDLRLSIGNLGGTPTAVLYRFISEQKQPRTFTSGVVQGWHVDWVGIIADAELKVTVNAGKGYTVEAAIPLASLGLNLASGTTLRGDVGVTHGDPGGTRTRLRTYWCNQQTGLVDDVVFELRVTPSNWGSLAFE